MPDREMMIERNKTPEASGLAIVGHWSCDILPGSCSSCVSVRLLLSLGEGEQSSQAYFLPPLLGSYWSKPHWTRLPTLCSNLLQVGCYLSPGAMVLGTLYPSFKKYDLIAPTNQQFPSYSLFLDILLGIRRKTQMSKLSTLWENSNFIHISKYSLHVDRLNDLKVFSNLNGSTTLRMQIRFLKASLVYPHKVYIQYLI